MFLIFSKLISTSLKPADAGIAINLGEAGSRLTLQMGFQGDPVRSPGSTYEIQPRMKFMAGKLPARCGATA